MLTRVLPLQYTVVTVKGNERKGQDMTETTKTYRTEGAAKRAANNALSPVVVQLQDGSFDWFPQGHPLPQGAVKVSFYQVNQWRDAI